MTVRIAVVGEAWGEQERLAQAPFVGPSGKLLNAWLAQAGIDRRECFVTNVFNLQPRPTNDVSNLCGPKAQGIPNMKPLSAGKYVRAEYKPELDRLWSELQTLSPNLIIALGATAVWALIRGQDSIKKTRGNVYHSHIMHRSQPTLIKVLPTYHPAAVLRQWTLRPVVLADLEKARRESEFPEVIRPHRELWIEPTLEDLGDFYERYIVRPEWIAQPISVDIETARDQITEIGFAPDPQHAIVVPFVKRSGDGNYWPTLRDELRAWKWVKHICENFSLLGQNFNYDMNYLWRYYGIRCPHAVHDTMLLHHSLQPEMEKSLGFLGSIYTNEPSWKFMRTDHSTLKAEDE